MQTTDLIKYKNYLINWIREYVLTSGHKGVVVGVSGGVDSAVVAVLAQIAFPNHHLLVFLPCLSPSIDYQMIEQLMMSGPFNYRTIDLTLTFKTLQESLHFTFDLNKVTLNNLKVRLRLASLYAIASSQEYLVLGTSNACEWYTGFFTKYGDNLSDLSPIIQLTKQHIQKLAKILHITPAIIERAPTPGFEDGVTDEMELKVTYDQIDQWLMNQSIDADAQSIIEQLHINSKHKRQYSFVPKTFKKLRKISN